MFFTGLTSITFRKLAVDEIIRLVAEAGLDGIEWGGDVHVPPGDAGLAERVAAATRNAGLRVLSYGSYFRCDNEDAEGLGGLTSTALALAAPVVRVWAGRKGSAEASPGYRAEVAGVIRKLVASMADADITVGLEYHGGTLTDTQESAHQLLTDVDDERLTLYWQPRTGGQFEQDLVELRAALPRLSHIHAFHWGARGWQERLPLACGRASWSAYLDLARQAAGDHAVIMEFVREDSPEHFLADAEVLKELVALANSAT